MIRAKKKKKKIIGKRSVYILIFHKPKIKIYIIWISRDILQDIILRDNKAKQLTRQKPDNSK